MNKKNNILALIAKYLILFVVGGIIYYIIENIFRGYSHWTMIVVGGLAFIYCGLINELLSWKTPFWLQSVIASLGITLLEFLSGCVINLWLKWGVWDYSNLPFNVFGQVCLLFTFLWVFVGGFAIVLDDWLRYKWFGEEKPHYKLF